MELKTGSIIHPTFEKTICDKLETNFLEERSKPRDENSLNLVSSLLNKSFGLLILSYSIHWKMGHELSYPLYIAGRQLLGNSMLITATSTNSKRIQLATLSIGISAIMLNLFSVLNGKSISLTTFLKV